MLKVLFKDWQFFLKCTSTFWFRQLETLVLLKNVVNVPSRVNALCTINCGICQNISVRISNYAKSSLQ